MAVSARILIERGIGACRSSEWQRAGRLFESAAAQISDSTGLPTQALAWYGLALASTDRKRINDAIRFCEAATRKDFLNPEMFYVLSRVYLLAGWRKAVDMLDRRPQARARFPGAPAAQGPARDPRPADGRLARARQPHPARQGAPRVARQGRAGAGSPPARP